MIRASLVPLQYPAFRNLAGGRLVSVLGNAIAPTALAFAVLDLTGSIGDLGLVVGARSLANLVFLLFGGVLADRLHRQIVMVASSASAAATQGAVACLVLTHHSTIPLLVGLSAVNGMVSAIALPATQALTPQTVPAEILQTANAINRFGVNLGTIGGASAGGLLIAALGPGWGIALDALSFALSGLAFSRVRVPEPTRVAAPRRGTLTELREGWTEFASRTWVWAVVVGFMVLNAAETSSLNVLGPAIADQTIGRREWGLVLATQTAGLALGALVTLWVRVRRLLLLGVACMLGVVPLLVVLAAAPRFTILLPAAFIAGLATEQFSVAWETSIQRNIPADRLARVYSYDALGSFLAIPLGQLAIGPVALAAGNEATLLLAAGLTTIAVLGMLLTRDVRRLGTQETNQRAAPTSAPAGTPSPDAAVPDATA
ncbi:MFS transporter [Rugosimonospora acidiphila]|uniref:MFS transporter n=1 Tax=Rugosimonospora acidiphila TaxID=556531 RepID=A0ABP9RLY3_9ACTN